jgi:predicted amino acid racemase
VDDVVASVDISLNSEVSVIAALSEAASRQVQAASRGYGITVYHCANSAVIFDLPEA